MPYTTIKKPSDYFNTVLYTGNSSTQSITGVNFQPDLAWIKRRSSIQYHGIYDSVRGATKVLASNATDAETTHDGLTSFDSDGYTLGNIGRTNTSGETYVGWNWLGANGTASNTDGSITSTVSANTTSGFSIVSYTGTGSNATVGHGLGVAPSMVIVKLRSSTGNWQVYHQTLGNTKAIPLNTTDTPVTDSGFWNNTSPTSSVFSLGTGYADNTNSNGGTYIAYCFAEKQGFSKFGSYTGNGSTDGTFIYTGFKPAFVLTKASSDLKDWVLLDNKRDNFNLMNKKLFSNNSDAEYSGQNACDFLSNGFKLRDNATNAFAINDSGRTHIYMAFADEPLVGDNPATAR